MSGHHRTHVSRLLASTILILVAGLARAPVASPTQPAYAAVGDSIEFGVGDDITSDGIGYVLPFGSLLSKILGPVEVHNFSVPSAQVRDILRLQLPSAVAAVQGHSPIIVSWGGGGNDLLEIGTGPQSAACRQSPSCLGRFAGLLNEMEQTIDQTIARLRGAVGPDARILMRTQYNGLIRTGCASPEDVALGNATLEGAPGTVLDRGLNTRIRAIASRYGATVVELFLPFAANANTLVAADCAHPTGLGYQLILGIMASVL